MPIVSHQISLVGATLILALAIIGILSQAGKAQEKRTGIVLALSWGALLFSILMILSNDAFSQFIISGLAKMQRGS